MDDKIIVSNRSAMAAKYGSAGLRKVKAAVSAMIAADAARGIKSRLVYLDEAGAMKKFKGRAVADRKSARQNKDAIDAIFKATSPEYLMILGATDVVPHQDMSNPVYAAGDDPDRHAYGDLPYACDAAYSRDPAAFKGPTRVIGRLPDLTGAREPSFLLALLAVAATYAPRPASAYGRYFGLSTQTWKASTAQSLSNLFGQSDAMKMSPPTGPKHAARELGAFTHFINCHGGASDPVFYGESRTAMPEALTSRTIARRIKPGTVAAVECCYGAELYDSITLALAPPICQHYLGQGAYGYFGSTTIAYGPAAGNGAADLITQYFLQAVLDGASLGRAALLARQRYVQEVSELDPIDLKTLAQFNLLGDPSVHPVRRDTPTSVPRSTEAADARRVQRRERRAKLRAMGEFLESTKPTASRQASGVRRSPAVQQALVSIAREAGIGSRSEFAAFDVKRPPAARVRGAKSGQLATRYYVAVSTPRSRRRDALNLGVAAVAKEVGGRIVGYRIYGQK
jgi:hypothetical protein